MSRRKYTKEFKEDAVRLVVEEGYASSEAARNLDINANMLRRWVKEYERSHVQAFRGKGQLSAEQDDIRRLRRENQQLKLEREILKKAAAFFVKESS